MEKIMRLLITVSIAAAITMVALCGSENPPLKIEQEDQPVEATEELTVVSYAKVLDRATPSVVAVYTTRLETVRSSPFFGPRGMEDIFRQFGMPMPNSGGTQERESTGVGSGVIISDDGYIITNRHVVAPERGQKIDAIKVRLADDREFTAELIGEDAKTDVAVLRIEADEPLPAIKIANSELLRVGDVVFAIGNPLEVGLTATKGIVSATGRDSLDILGAGSYENFIQTDAAINMGNSGGALIDAWGRLIGINTAILSRSGGSIGIGLAIPSNLAIGVAHKLVNSGEVQRGLLGIIPGDLNSELAESFDLKSTKGAIVNQVQEGSPAEAGGLEHGDVIIEIDGAPIDSARQLRLTVSQMEPGREVEVKVIRDGKTLSLPITLGDLNGTASSGKAGVKDLHGLNLEPVDDELRESASIPDRVQGLYVKSLDGSSPFAEVLRPGVVIVEANRVPVRSIDDFREHLRVGINRFYIWYGGNFGYIGVRLEAEE
jgi:serine protease Do/serine protease DegQ